MILPSTGRGSAEFAPLAEQLVSRGYRVVLPEPRDIAGSQGRMTNVSFHDFGNDFAKVIAAEGGPAIVAGQPD